MDTHFDFDITFDIDGFVDNVLLCNDENNSIPWFARLWIYNLLSILALGWL